MKTMGDRVKTLRKLNSMSQKEFGSIVAVSRTHIANIEANKRMPSKPLLMLICYKFGIAEEWLRDECDTLWFGYQLK